MKSSAIHALPLRPIAASVSSVLAVAEASAVRERTGWQMILDNFQKYTEGN